MSGHGHGHDFRTIQGLLGHKDVSTTMVHTPCSTAAPAASAAPPTADSDTPEARHPYLLIRQPYHFYFDRSRPPTSDAPVRQQPEIM
jgi:hypothetical protein